MKFLDKITVLSFAIGLYALYIALENNELKEILMYLENHLQDQDNHLHNQDEHLKAQDELLSNLTR